MRLLVTGASGLLGSNLAAAAAQQSWDVLGTWRRTPVAVPGAHTARLDVLDRQACVRLAEECEPDVVVHAAVPSSLADAERDPRSVERAVRGVESTLAAARAVRAGYVLVSSEYVFSGSRSAPPAPAHAEPARPAHAVPAAPAHPEAAQGGRDSIWEEEDPTEPRTALGRAHVECERLTRRFAGPWLITRPAEVYGVNLAVAAAAPVRHVWERSGAALRWVARLRAEQPVPAPASVQRTPTYAWDYAQVVCELVAQECEGVYHTPGPTVLGRLGYQRLVARAFDCDPRLVQEGPLDAEPADPEPAPPADLALSDAKAAFVLGRPGCDPIAGLRLAHRQLERVLGRLGVAVVNGWDAHPHITHQHTAEVRAHGGLG